MLAKIFITYDRVDDNSIVGFPIIDSAVLERIHLLLQTINIKGNSYWLRKDQNQE